MKKLLDYLMLLLMSLSLLGVLFVKAKANEITFNPVIDIKTTFTLPKVYLPNHSLEQNIYMAYAYRISDSKEFLYKLKAENGAIDPTAQSKVVMNGIREPSFGFCQTHAGYHPEIVNDPRFFTDWQWQMDQCWKLYKGKVAMYGVVTQKIRNMFKFN